MITVSFRCTHGFKIMRAPQPIIPFRGPLQPVQALCSRRGGEIDVLYILCIDGWLPETYEILALAEDGVREVHRYARVRLFSEFSEDTFHTHFFNARRFQVPLLGCRSLNESVEFLDIVRITQHVQSRVAYWTQNLFVHSWGPFLSMIPHTVSTITRCAYNLPVTFHVSI